MKKIITLIVILLTLGVNAHPTKNFEHETPYEITYDGIDIAFDSDVLPITKATNNINRKDCKGYNVQGVKNDRYAVDITQSRYGSISDTNKANNGRYTNNKTLKSRYFKDSEKEQSNTCRVYLRRIQEVGGITARNYTSIARNYYKAKRYGSSYQDTRMGKASNLDRWNRFAVNHFKITKV